MKAKIEGRVRIAIIGTGGISHPHAKGIMAHRDKAECTALCDVSEDNLKARSEQLGGVGACAAFGPMNHFLVMLPEKPEMPRDKNLSFMVESFTELAPMLEKNKARLVIEGWPGPGALCCTPEGYRAFFKECSSKAMGIKFDPSHLIRMGIDPLRFLREFAERVGHIRPGSRRAGFCGIELMF